MVVIAARGFGLECIDFGFLQASTMHRLRDSAQYGKGITIAAGQLNCDIWIFDIHFALRTLFIARFHSAHDGTPSNRSAHSLKMRASARVNS
jgi:hypothetical protein